MTQDPEKLRQWSHTVRYEPAERSAWERVLTSPVTFFVSLSSLLLLILLAAAQFCGVL
jgi:hypothetical protein